jgi:hypothetical protein
MAIIITNELSSSVKKPDVGKLSIFYETGTGNMLAKNSSGNIFTFGGIGKNIFTQVFNATNNSTTNQNLGSVYLNAGTLSISASALLGTSNGTDTAVVDLYKDSTATIVTTWSASNAQPQPVSLSAPAVVPSSDWYSVRMRVNTGIDTAILLGIKFVFE